MRYGGQLREHRLPEGTAVGRGVICDGSGKQARGRAVGTGDRE